MDAGALSLRPLCIWPLAAALLFGGCSRTGTFGAARGTDTLQAGFAIAPNSFNPLLLTESAEFDLDGLVFNGLTEENERNQIVPNLATVVPTLHNGGIGRDGTTITYHLRKGVRWQDDVPFTSDDVKFTWQAIMAPNSLVSNRVPYDQVASVDTPDASTVVFHLKRLYAPFVAEAFNSSTIGFIVPAHLLRRYRDLRNVPFNQAPIGTGPYRLARWIRGDRMIFTANQAYFKGAPRIRTIVVHEIPNENTAINQLRSGELDWYPYISEASYDLLRSVPNVRVVVTPQNSYRALYVNTERPILSDVRVRRAIAYAINKRQLVEKTTFGTGTVATEDIPDFMWAYDPSVPTMAQDLGKARELLREAGWTPGPDGVLTKGGRQLSFTLSLRQGAVGDNAMAVLVQAWLRSVGIDVTLKDYPGAVLFALGPSGVLEPGKYDLNISGFSSTADPDNSAQFTCNNRPPNGFNWTRYCSPEMDRLQAAALGTYDRAARKAAYAKIETLLATDVPQVFFYYQPQISAISPRLANFAPSMVTPTWNVEQWELR